MIGNCRPNVVGAIVLWTLAGCAERSTERATAQGDAVSRTTPVAESAPLPDVARHIVMVEAETRPRGVSRRFPALVVACDGASSLLLSASWGAEPFPIGGPDGIPIGVVFLSEGERPVQIIGYDERSGVSVFAVEQALPPLPRELWADPVKSGDRLEGLNVSEKEEPELRPLNIVGVGRTFRRQTTTDEWIGVEGTIQFTGESFGNPGAVLLKENKVAAIFLNNEGDMSRRFALPIDRAFAAYQSITKADRE